MWPASPRPTAGHRLRLGAPRRAAARRHLGGDGENQSPALFPAFTLGRARPDAGPQPPTPGATSWWPCARAGRTAWSPCGSATGFSGARRWTSSAGREAFTATLDELYNEDGEAIQVAPHAEMVVRWKTDLPVEAGAYLRMKKEPRSE
ncbi:MAG: U32 family peptidase C-terminal domain-containing protein [Acutalibacter sp.]